MKQAFNHLLVIQQQGVDDSEALSRALQLALQHNSRITVFKSFYQHLQKRPYDNPQADDDLAVFVRQQQQAICAQIDAQTAQRIDLDLIISWREAEKPAIARLLQHSDISMVITLQRKPQRLLGLLPLGLEHYLISDCPLPVWLVKPATAEQEMTILACLDVDSELPGNSLINTAILELGQQLATTAADQLHVINCYCNDNYSMSLPYDERQGFIPLPDIAAQHQQKLQPYLSQHRLPAHCLHLSEGLPDDEIPRAATSLHSQLAIIGNNHMHSFGSAILGDTAHYLTEHTPCDVLVVKPSPLADTVQRAQPL